MDGSHTAGPPHPDHGAWSEPEVSGDLRSAGGLGESIDDEALRALGNEVLRLSRRRVQLPEESTLDRSSFRILWALAETGPLSMRELEEMLQLEQSTVSRQVKAAIGRGLLEFLPAPGTRRRLLRATPDGERVYAHEGALRAEVFKKALAEFGPDRVRALAAELGALNDAVDRLTAAEPARTPGRQ
ncbi:MarR family transcriptional regulator [Frankia sp. CcI49]|uniref:MarR family winged helix-turn-helix transcriptional regulator n=1 Tax=unclassified Frankia TaxID=2632575 RepID=UPI0006C9EE7C|nr:MULTISPECIES: MarR family winged helix-turn-helix transcriptional regulator [unclassified Frankia]ONH62515.1 MarR family transcriptional regulator [Frankia sp. CcI49]